MTYTTANPNPSDCFRVRNLQRAQKTTNRTFSLSEDAVEAASYLVAQGINLSAVVREALLEMAVEVRAVRAMEAQIALDEATDIKMAEAYSRASAKQQADEKRRQEAIASIKVEMPASLRRR